jgi:hypothetical protein
MGKAIWPASGLSEGREWYSISSIIEEYGVVELRPDLMIYVDNRPDDISLVADSKNICRPDLVIQCVDRLTWEHNSWCRDLEKIKSYSEILKPAFGAFMVSKDHVPENRRKIMGESIPLLEVGFNQFRLDPILDVLRQ